MQKSTPNAYLQIPDVVKGFFCGFPMGIFLLDENGIILDMNARQEQNSRISRDLLLGKSVFHVFQEILDRYGLGEEIKKLLLDRIPLKTAFEEYQPQYYVTTTGARFWGFPLDDSVLSFLIVEKLDSAEPRRSAEIIGTGDTMKEIFDFIERASNVSIPVLIEGESGTGKELVARAIHASGRRREKPFLPINCAALSPQLLESTLFGHERGAFTGADRKFQGYFEAATGGTLFLDEFGDASETIQAKLLRVLQDGIITRLGSTEALKTDVRLLCATNRNLTEDVRTGRFRRDLYFRVNVLQITLPPLRERKNDLPLLIKYFLDEMSRKHRFGNKFFSPKALGLLHAYPWPGNNRELANVIESSYVLCKEEVITERSLPARLLEGSVDQVNAPLGTLSYRDAQSRFQKAYLADLAQRSCGNWKMAARLAGVNPSTLYRMRASAKNAR